MSITKTQELKRILIVLSTPESELQITYHDTFDDPNDDELPHVMKRVVDIQRFDEDDNPTDITGFEQVVQDIAAVVWTDEPETDGE